MEKSRGMTLIELLVTMAIAAILMALAAPSFIRTVRSGAMSSAVNTFQADLRYARSESVKRGGRILMCRSDAPEAAAPTCATTAGSTGKGWATGWVIFQDVDASGGFSTGDTILRVQSGITSVDSILQGTASASTTFAFSATGRLTSTTLATKLTFGGSDFDTSLKRVLCVGAGGRARVAGDGSASCGTNNE